METTPNLQVYDLGHLGLVASILDQIGLVQTVDQFVQPAGPEGETHSQAHLALGVSTHVGSPGGAGGQVARPQPGSPSRDRGVPPGGRAILPAGVKGVRNVGRKQGQQV